MVKRATLAADAPADLVGEGAGSGGQCAEQQVEPAGDFFVPVGGFSEVGLDVADEVAAFASVELVEVFVEGHAHRVTPISLHDVWRAVWLDLPQHHRDVLAAAITVGCLLFMVLGACLR
jgi:hypothetical protein